MTRPDLEARAERLEEDLTSISDTVIDIKETVDGHTTEFAAVRGTLAEHGSRLGGIEGSLTRHNTYLAEHTTRLVAIEGLVVEILRRLDPR